MEKQEKIEKIGEFDKKILNLLLEDSRLSYRKIAGILKVSPATIMNRTNNLHKNIIKKYSALLDYEKLGYEIEVIIELRISKGKLIEVEKKIATHPNVVAVYDITGDFDAVIIARFKNRKSMDYFLKKIQTYDFIERTFTKFILHTIKEEPLRID
ncbi:Lrp/AsnC family transcriptional regulator [Candidatus Pacearchaeota archaeon]|nr:Lrp/AsnC family transcriptional regulator [Candidatus Pacearchaeota archaeon]